MVKFTDDIANLLEMKTAIHVGEAIMRLDRAGYSTVAQRLATLLDAEDWELIGIWTDRFATLTPWTETWVMPAMDEFDEIVARMNGVH